MMGGSWLRGHALLTVVSVPLKRKPGARRLGNNTTSRASISHSILLLGIHMAFKALSKSEKAYIQASLQAQSPLRGDGRSLHQFRAVTLQTGVVPIANGSAHLNLGRSSDESMGGTEILAAAKLEVEDIAALGSSSSSSGRIMCTVSWCVASSYSDVKKTDRGSEEKFSRCLFLSLSDSTRRSPARLQRDPKRRSLPRVAAPPKPRYHPRPQSLAPDARPHGPLGRGKHLRCAFHGGASCPMGHARAEDQSRRVSPR